MCTACNEEAANAATPITECYAPGWDRGPALLGGEPDYFVCERPSGHTGDHAWRTLWPDGIDAIHWPVAEAAE